MAAKENSMTRRRRAVSPITLKTALLQVLNSEPAVSCDHKKQMRQCPIADGLCRCKALMAARGKRLERAQELFAALKGQTPIAVS